MRTNTATKRAQQHVASWHSSLRACGGGLDDLAKEEMIARVTEVVRQHLGLTVTDRAPVYVLIREVLPSNWGVFGGRITVSDLRKPPDANPSQLNKRSSV